MIQQMNKRLQVNDFHAFYNTGALYFNGDDVAQDKTKALEYYFRAAELGSAEASYAVARAYNVGDGVAKDEKKAEHYEELAAMQGNNEARHNLGLNEAKASKYDRALRHWLISCERGFGESLKCIKRLFVEGHANKEEYEKARKLYEKYIEEIKSDQRDEAAAFREEWRYLPLQANVLDISFRKEMQQKETIKRLFLKYVSEMKSSQRDEEAAFSEECIRRISVTLLDKWEV
jgi:TPR repeat protein